ncbi:hypothetical protein CYMTET_28318 [Cymbomonas tetramitiformis]|uniref:Uncharacterized protein n=1 Tax=Cymbomonas tetramitiformis TaxID=36881 RepID=A0AAE0FPK5_9CHLO|nr:hypothetical protein CYMTET_28318 [Cymbomonas tetramitiformis]
MRLGSAVPAGGGGQSLPVGGGGCGSQSVAGPDGWAGHLFGAALEAAGRHAESGSNGIGASRKVRQGASKARGKMSPPQMAPAASKVGRLGRRGEPSSDGPRSEQGRETREASAHQVAVEMAEAVMVEGDWVESERRL